MSIVYNSKNILLNFDYVVGAPYADIPLSFEFAAG